MTVVHCCRGPRLANEALPEFRIRGDGRGHDLQCDQPAELILTGFEDDRHAAVADLLLQHVLADPAARAVVIPIPWLVADHSTSGPGRAAVSKPRYCPHRATSPSVPDLCSWRACAYRSDVSR